MRNISIFGDSISTYEGIIPFKNRTYYSDEDPNATGVDSCQSTWWMQVIDALDGSLLANASYSGSLVAGEGFPAGRSMERAEQVLGEDQERPDDIFVFIGINDYGWGGSKAQQKADPNTGLAPVDALSEFAQGYDEMLENLKTVAPDARIWCLTLLPGRLAQSDEGTFCPKLRGIDIEEYNKVIRMAALANHCEVADIGRLGFDYSSTDGTHPDPLGMKQLASMVVKTMDDEHARKAATTTSHQETLAGLEEAFRSTPSCERPAGVGCPHARSWSDQWSCVCEERIDPQEQGPQE